VTGASLGAFITERIAKPLGIQSFVFNAPETKVGIHYTCPRCWINNGTPVSMTPIVSEAEKELFRCDTCHFELGIEH
jgi:CubicO group peptidase (beta-lactamase class C family)